MRIKHVVMIGLVCSLFFSGCSLIGDILKIATKPAKSKKKEEAAPVKPPEVFCTYFHYFRNDNFSQWIIDGKDPTRTIGNDPWRRDIWLGSVTDYPYIGAYDNVRGPDVMRWHIQLAKAAGISAFLLFVNNWEQEAAQTTRLLDVAQQEQFKIGFIDHPGALGAARGIIDGRPMPIISPKYKGTTQMLEYFSQKMGISLPAAQTRYITPQSSRKVREVPQEVMEEAISRISGMLNRWKSHPAYLKIDGKPLIVFPYLKDDVTKIIPPEFKTMVDRLEALVKEDLYVVAIIPQVYWYMYPPAVMGSGINQEWADCGADSFTHWTPNGMITEPQKTRLKVTQFNVKNSLKWKKDAMIPVMPGFDDEAWRPGDIPAPVGPRLNGEPWRDQLSAAIKARPRFIFIQGWNEWHEGSQIEPSTGYSDPYLYLQILAQQLGKRWETPPLPSKTSVDPLRLPYLQY